MIVKQFSTEGDDPVSTGIRRVQHSPDGLPFTHVDLVMPDGTLLGARSDGGVAIRSSTYADFTKKLVVSIPADDAQTDAYYAFARSQIGKPYDYEAVFAFLAPSLTRDWTAADSWFCSELDAAAMLVAGCIPSVLSVAVNKITPYDDVLMSLMRGT